MISPPAGIVPLAATLLILSFSTMTTASAIVPCPSHSFPNFTALVAAVALSATASKKARTRMHKRSAEMLVESRIDCPPVAFSRHCHNFRVRESTSARQKVRSTRSAVGQLLDRIPPDRPPEMLLSKLL